MSASINSAAGLITEIRKKAPEYIDLLTAKTDDDFDKAFDAVLGPVIARMEENKVNFASLDEVGLTAVLCTGLSVPGVTASAEKHSNGHVDLTIEANHCVPVRKKLGEAKIWNGYEYHVSGLAQLIERYSTGRETSGLLIIYFQKHSGIDMLIRRLREEMDDKLPCRQQGEAVDHVHKWSFRSSHSHDSGIALQISHVGCNMYVAPAAGKK